MLFFGGAKIIFHTNWDPVDVYNYERKTTFIKEKFMNKIFTKSRLSKTVVS